MTWAKLKAIANRSAFSRPPLDCFDPIGLIGSTMRTGLVPLLKRLQAPLPKLWPAGTDVADKPDREEQKEKESLPFSVKQNNHFNDGLCLDATHSKPGRCWLPSVSHLRFWHQGSFSCFFFVYDENKTVGLIPDLHTLEHTGKRTDKREGSKHVTKQSTNTTGLPAEVRVRAAWHVPSCRKQKTADTGTGVFEQGIFHLQTETMLRSRSRCKCCVKSEESRYVPVRAPRSQTGTLLILRNREQHLSRPQSATVPSCLCNTLYFVNRRNISGKLNSDVLWYINFPIF